MDELLRQRIERRLDNLPDDKAYQVLDYLEFLESKYADRSGGASALEKIADRVEDTMRAGRVSVSAIKGTREVIDAAGRVMDGLADAGRNVIDELQAPLKPQPETKQSTGAESSPDAQAPPDEGDVDPA